MLSTSKCVLSLGDVSRFLQSIKQFNMKLSLKGKVQVLLLGVEPIGDPIGWPFCPQYLPAARPIRCPIGLPIGFGPILKICAEVEVEVAAVEEAVGVGQGLGRGVVGGDEVPDPGWPVISVLGIVKSFVKSITENVYG